MKEFICGEILNVDSVIEARQKANEKTLSFEKCIPTNIEYKNETIRFLDENIFLMFLLIFLTILAIAKNP